MSPSLYLLLNHQLTFKQEQDDRQSLGVGRIIELPRDLNALWRRVPPDLEDIMDYLEPIGTWLEKHAAKKDYVLIQGDFGAAYIMVSFAFEIGLIPLYSTTLREAVEEHGEDGTVKMVHHFKHRMFRRYEP